MPEDSLLLTRSSSLETLTPGGAFLQKESHSSDLCSTTWPLLTYHRKKFSVSNISPSPLSPSQSAFSKTPRRCWDLCDLCKKKKKKIVQKRRKEGPLLGAPWGTVCHLLTSTVVFIGFSKLSQINTRKLWLEAERVQKDDLEIAFRFQRQSIGINSFRP